MCVHPMTNISEDRFTFRVIHHIPLYIDRLICVERRNCCICLALWNNQKNVSPNHSFTSTEHSSMHTEQTLHCKWWNNNSINSINSIKSFSKPYWNGDARKIGCQFIRFAAAAAMEYFWTQVTWSLKLILTHRNDGIILYNNKISRWRPWLFSAYLI